MLTVSIPDNNFCERRYIIEVLLSDYLGLQYNLLISNITDYLICFDKKELIIRDDFFKFYPDVLSYLNVDALPQKTEYIRNEFTDENDVPIIYGTDEMLVNEHHIICGIDVFASSFFMLTRWEEYVNKTRDVHSRYPGDESIAFKNGFLHRPIVNEYAEILWKMLYKLGYKGKRKQKRFELILSHDVDQFRYFRIILGDILRRRNLKLAKEHSKYFVKLGSNPFDTFDFIMTSSEKVGLKSHFNFASSNSKLPLEPEFYLRIKRFRSTIKKIKERGHIIGFHPGYYTFNNLDKWHNEKLLLEEFVQNNIIEGRQHYLRFDVPKTFRIWDKNNMEIDSTLGYADKEGFRCGTGDLFNVFDFLERTRLNVKECPLIIMDGTLLLHRKYTQEQAMEILKYYIQIGVKYKTKITLLFHNSSFFGEWEGYKSIYTNIIELAK